MHGIPEAELLRQVEEFVKEKGLEDRVDLFKKGALLAQKPGHFEDIPGITEEEKEHIRRETTRRSICAERHRLAIDKILPLDRWSQSKSLYLTIVICSLAAAVQCVVLAPILWQ